MESGTISEVRGTEVTGCPVMHQDFSTTRELGDYWDLANELRESCPHFYNKYAGGGYWVFTRHEAVNDIYKTPEIFSSASITPWEPNPIYRFVPTQVDAPDHIKYRRILNPWFSPKAMEAAAPMIRELVQEYIEPIVPKRRVRVHRGLRAAVPDRGVPERDRRARVLHGAVRGVGRHVLRRLRRGPRRRGGNGHGARRRCGCSGRSSSPTGAASGPDKEGDLFVYLLKSEFDDEPLDDEVLLDMCTVLTLAGLDTTRAELGYMFRHLALQPRPPPAARREPRAHPARGRGGPALLHDHLRRRPQGHPRRGVPRRAAQEGRHGLRAGVRREPRPAALGQRGRVRHRPQEEQPLRLRERPAPLPRHAPRPPRDGDRGGRVAEGGPGLRARLRRAGRARRRRDDGARQAPARAGRCRREAPGRPRRASATVAATRSPRSCSTPTTRAT